MKEYILDIDHMVGLMAGNETLVRRIGKVKKEESRFGITLAILGGLYFLVRSSQQMDINMAALTELVSDLQIWEFDRGSAEITGEILTQMHSLNRPITPIEAQIAAVARQRQAVLLTGLERFIYVRDIELQNWLR
ncbi:MAG: type II toxin-antitoxin system VapC family toxin [Armatimonadota bacterium]